MKKAIVVAMLLCFAVSTFADGMYWQSKTEGLGAPSTAENFAMPKKFKVVLTHDSKAGSIIIARLDKSLFWTLHPEKKTYNEMTFAEMEQMMAKASANAHDPAATLKALLQAATLDLGSSN